MVKGVIEDLKDYVILDRGFCWGTEPRPDSTGEKISEVLDSTVFTSLINCSKVDMKLLPIK